MKYITFYRESNKFADILTDVVVKKSIRQKVSWHQYLMIGLEDFDGKNEQVISYVTLKYGDDMRNEVVKDRSPVSGVDYMPKR
jgi:hypothetical protein